MIRILSWGILLGACGAAWGQSSLRLIADTTLRHSQPQATGGTQGQLAVSADAVSYLEFDWTEFPAFLTKNDFRSARLRLFVNRRNRSGRIWVKSICTGIAEQSLTMWSRPVWECNGPQVGVVVPEGGQWLTVDITEMLSGRLREGALSFELSTSDADVLLDSKESLSTSQPPQLLLEFALPPGPGGLIGPMGPVGPSGPMGLMGPVGVTGAPGPQGRQGQRASNGSVYWLSRRLECGAGEKCTRTLDCRAGDVIVGGGCGHRDRNQAAFDVLVNYSGPSIVGSRSDESSTIGAWRCSVDNTNPFSSRDYEIWVSCARRAD